MAKGTQFFGVALPSLRSVLTAGLYFAAMLVSASEAYSFNGLRNKLDRGQRLTDPELDAMSLAPNFDRLSDANKDRLLGQMPSGSYQCNNGGSDFWIRAFGSHYIGPGGIDFPQHCVSIDGKQQGYGGNSGDCSHVARCRS